MVKGEAFEKNVPNYRHGFSVGGVGMGTADKDKEFKV